MKCLIENCIKEAHCRGYCNAHYLRLLKYGNPLGGSRFNYGKGWVRKDGYRVINKKRENRLIMEAYVGRGLRNDEQVHHKNGDRLDNRIENLEIVSAHYHGVYLSGKRKYYVCTVEGCGNKHKANGLCDKHYMREYRKCKSGS